MRTMAMLNARRLGLFLLLIACAPLIMAAGGGPDDRCTISGFTFKDRNTNGVQDPFDPASSMTIRLYDATTNNFLTQLVADPAYSFSFAIPGAVDVCERSFIICAVLQSNWTQTLPSVAGADVVSCAGIEPDLAPLGYRRTLGEFDSPNSRSPGNDFAYVVPTETVPGTGLIGGTVFNDQSRNGVQDPGDVGLERWSIHVFGTTSAGAVHHQTFTDPGGSYQLLLEQGVYTVCEELPTILLGPLGRRSLGWLQTAPLAGPAAAGFTLADCTEHAEASDIQLAPKGYHVTVIPGTSLAGADFGNTSSVIKGVKFNDLNGNGVRDPGEPGIPGWPIHLIGDSFGEVTKPQPGPLVYATITVDRHTRRPPGGETVGTCQAFPGCSTTMGQRAKIVLTQGPRRAEAVFDVESRFDLGCVQYLNGKLRTILPPQAEIGPLPTGVFDEGGHFYGGYTPLSSYWMPPADVLASLFAKIGIPIDPPAYAPIIKAVSKRECVRDPNPANGAGAGVLNPGILVVQAEIGFVSTLDKEVRASTSTNASGEYAFELPPGTYTLCEALPPGWRQTAPRAGPNIVSCAGTSADLATQGYVVTLSDPGQAVPGKDFGNAAFSALTALSDTRLWLGLKNSDDQGTLFDVKVELLKNGSPVASGLRRCIAGLTRNPTLAKIIHVPWDALNPVPLAAGDVLALKVSTRIGTNSDNSKCAPERGSSHAGARGLRLYYDAASRPAYFDATLTSDSNQARYLDSNGTVCSGGGPESANVTERTLTSTPPIAPAAKCKDSSPITFDGGNPFKEVGTWTLP